MKKSSSAFTLIEIILVVVIFSLITIPLLFNYLNVSNSQGLKTSLGETANLIKSAHIFSREAKDQKAWGVVSIDEDTLALVSGTQANYEIKQELTLSRGVQTVGLIALWFNLSTGEAENEMIITLINRNGRSGQLIVHKTGVVDTKLL